MQRKYAVFMFFVKEANGLKTNKLSSSCSCSWSIMAAHESKIYVFVFVFFKIYIYPLFCQPTDGLNSVEENE